jgi:8-oxo-(d)GTP phosphatase
MRILLVRHGHAGSKHSWVGEDDLRPLSHRGREEGEALVRLLRPYAPGRIVSSPLVRCLQTVRPLADALGLTIEESNDLRPGAGTAATRLARHVDSGGSDAVVLCTHGEVVRAMKAQIKNDEMTIFGRVSDQTKGSVWVLDRVCDRFGSAKYLDPFQSH